jgi:hypothetical protein
VRKVKNDLESKMATLIARCWMDAEFRKRFVAEPKAVIAEALLNLAPNAELVILEDTRQKRHLVIPVAPPEGFSMSDIQTAAQQMFGTPASPYCFSEQAAAPYCQPASESLSDPYCFRELTQPAEPYCFQESALYYIEQEALRAEPYCCEDSAPYCLNDPDKGSKP